uniref:Rubisco LSMT substrate-binding domain-containing protein n=1 Tax=Chromera velia CCMP2878 TaxID=1169474 RepID=A0A0G4FAE1_9ALVE|mmetsp:Transcript_7300/g.14278  ORF Transcript_7300/g.14278 Transcript_7300/m.14278 type:complete len:641 (-) Transcript_7300:232-2154(-)|eukprot:Cvel_173.t1-p1 / transcript=Cvel_173.t1 / gene=Cvel_173 / organism=Chromera_velia_CCMP2878 / gene_product=hypothetical protein / transcript_product=hypothetical protein / location=Cvel_scaffold11:4062-10134(-) / protein_length=640 / sequence_SO=supercontig / SO=protein_coding / is_pseudo=false
MVQLSFLAPLLVLLPGLGVSPVSAFLPGRRVGTVARKVLNRRDGRHGGTLTAETAQAPSNVGVGKLEARSEAKIIRDFESWALLKQEWSGGGPIEASNLKHAIFLDAGEDKSVLVQEVPLKRGLKTTTALVPGDKIIEVPRSRCIAALGRKVECPKDVASRWIKDSAAWKELLRIDQLALLFLWEVKKKSLYGQGSRVQPYLDFVPPVESMNTAVHWTDEELNFLRYPPIREYLGILKESRMEAYDDLKRKFPSFALEVSFEEFEWALEIVKSRAIRGDFTPVLGRSLFIGSLAFSVLFALFGLFTYINPDIFKLPYEDDAILNLSRFTLLLPLLTSELNPLVRPDRNFVEDPDLVLAPFLDSVNHLNLAETKVELDTKKDRLVLSVDKPYRAGEQVFANLFGRPLDNDELLIFHGYAEPNNVIDSARLNITEFLEESGILDERERVLPGVFTIISEAEGLREAGLDKMEIFPEAKAPNLTETTDALRMLLAPSTQEMRVILDKRRSSEPVPYFGKVFANLGADTELATWRCLEAACKWHVDRLTPSKEDKEQIARLKEAGKRLSAMRLERALTFRSSKVKVIQDLLARCKREQKYFEDVLKDPDNINPRGWRLAEQATDKWAEEKIRVDDSGAVKFRTT